ncbi:MAG: FtsX-like permease family protein [Acidobacteriota bacterium]
MHSLFHEIRLAGRSLRASPLTTTAAIVVMALGIGANLAVFAVTWGILVRPLPYTEPARLVILSFATAEGVEFGLPLTEVEEWQRRLRTVESLAGYSTAEIALQPVGGADASEPRLVQAALVTASFFDVLGAHPASGGLAGFGESSGVAVLSERAIPSERFGASNGTASSAAAIRAGDRSYAVGAILPRDFAFPSDTVEAWLPPEAVAADGVVPEGRKFRLVARLAPGVTLAQMYDDAIRVVREIRGEYAATTGGTFPSLTPVPDAILGEVRPVLRASTGAAMLVLLVTCSNVAMLLLGQAALRRRDSAVRAALGASWWQLARGSVAESFLLASIGSLLGLWLAEVAVGLFLHRAAHLVPRSHVVGIDGTVLAAGVAMVFVATLLCGAAPALRASRRDFAAALRGGSTNEPRTRRLLALLVAAQIAGSIVLLSGATLLAATVSRLLAEETGVAARQSLVARLARGAGAANDPVARELFARQVLQEVHGLPGVEEAGIGSSLPPRALPFQILVRFMTEQREEGLSMSVISATPGYLDALDAGLVSGRLFEARDERREDPPILLSETAARFYAPGKDLTDHELPIRLPPIAKFTAPSRVIGVVHDVKYAGLDQPAAAAVYLPWSARPAETSFLAVRAAGDVDALVPAIRRILRQVDPDLPIPEIRTLADQMTQSISDRRLRVFPAVGFAAVALAVALTGVFAVLARAAAERRRELAIRIALGASKARVLRLMMRRATGLTAAGLVAGLAGTLAMARGLGSLLYGVAPTDPWILGGVMLFVALAAFAAAYLPARRAARVSPWELLRME